MFKQRKSSYQTEVMTQAEPDYQEPPKKSVKKHTTKREVTMSLKPQIPMELPDYRQEKGYREFKVPNNDSGTPGIIKKAKGNDKIHAYKFDPSAVKKSALYGHQKKFVDWTDIVGNDNYKNAPREKMYTPKTESANNAKLHYRSGHMAFFPTSRINDKYNKLMLCGVGSSLYDPPVQLIGIRLGGYQCMTREKYNQSIK